MKEKCVAFSSVFHLQQVFFYSADAIMSEAVHGLSNVN